MKKFSFSLFVLILVAQKSQTMENQQHQNTNQKEEISLLDKHHSFAQKIEHNTNNPATLEEYVFETCKLLAQADPKNYEKILKKSQNNYNRFKEDTRKKTNLWHLDDNLSNKKNNAKTTEQNNSNSFYEDIKNKLESINMNNSSICQLEQTLCKIEQQRKTDIQEINNLESQIVLLNAKLETIQINGKANSDKFTELTSKLEKGKQANNIILGIAKVRKNALELEHKKILDNINLELKGIDQFENELTKETTKLERKGTLLNSIEKSKNIINELQKKQQNLTILIQKAERHINGQTTFDLNWLPFSWSSKTEIEQSEPENTDENWNIITNENE